MTYKSINRKKKFKSCKFNIFAINIINETKFSKQIFAAVRKTDILIE